MRSMNDYEAILRFMSGWAKHILEKPNVVPSYDLSRMRELIEELSVCVEKHDREIADIEEGAIQKSDTGSNQTYEAMLRPLSERAKEILASLSGVTSDDLEKVKPLIEELAVCVEKHERIILLDTNSERIEEAKRQAKEYSYELIVIGLLEELETRISESLPSSKNGEQYPSDAADAIIIGDVIEGINSDVYMDQMQVVERIDGAYCRNPDMMPERCVLYEGRAAKEAGMNKVDEIRRLTRRNGENRRTAVQGIDGNIESSYNFLQACFEARIR